MAMLRQTHWFQEIIEQGLEEGRREGHREGRREGIDEGVRRSIQRILEQRFGPLPPGMVAALDAHAGDQLEVLTTAALTVESLEQFQAQLGMAS
jgi:predicted transposase YdaD